MKIVDFPWHQAHSYRLHALDADFTYLSDVRPVLWSTGQRPMPPNFMGGIGRDEVRPGMFDVALLHLDQWCAMMNLRALPYRVMRVTAEKNNIPMIVIMHGTPDNEENRQQILKLIGDLPVVCNSHQAAYDWDNGECRKDKHGFLQFRSIIHGYNTSEFWSKPLAERDREIITVCSGGNISRVYHGIPLLERVKREVPVVWYGARGDRKWLPSYTEYRDLLASSLVYFSPTRRAPMPGARTEAMLSGCCIVSVPGNDIEAFIVDGESGFIVHSFAQVVDTLRTLLNNPAMAYEVGQRGKLEARRLFTSSRFVDDWAEVFSELGII